MSQIDLNLRFSNSFSSLGEDYFSRVSPTPFKSPSRLVHFNRRASKLLELESGIEKSSDFLHVFSGSSHVLGGDPLAMLYSGHQFGQYVPQLGDGRAIMLGELSNTKDEKWEIQLKGSGLTPYSRNGDGRAVLRSTIREYLCSEAMFGLGIPTTTALCMTVSEDEVYRENMERGAVLTRLAPSHIRFGSFEVFYYRNQHEKLAVLADYVIQNHYPEILTSQDQYTVWLKIIVDRTAKLIAQWQAIGFCHGVMNTDNMSVLGLTLDYGPFAFMEAYEPTFVCNHSDYQGRYAYNQQSKIGLFNLSCFAQSILPLLSDTPEKSAEIATEILKTYHSSYDQYFSSLMQKKLGFNESMQSDLSLIDNLHLLMAEDKVDFTILYRQLCKFRSSADNNSIRDLFIQRDKFDEWARSYTNRLGKEDLDDGIREKKMLATNPKYILRNYMAETAIRKAEDDKDYSEISRVFDLLEKPFDEQPENEKYAGFPPDWASRLSVSCSS